MRILIFLAPLFCAACFWFDETEMSTFAKREQIVQAAQQCGIEDFQPTPAGAGWAAYVSKEVPDWRQKEDCIYAGLEAEGLRATR